jgi:hypothetical protein
VAGLRVRQMAGNAQARPASNATAGAAYRSADSTVKPSSLVVWARKRKLLLCRRCRLLALPEQECLGASVLGVIEADIPAIPKEDHPMYARLISMSGTDAGKREQALQMINESVLPTLRQFDG